jgi:exodeoxyribonuclease VII small subunit
MDAAAISALSFEDALKRLEAIVHSLESGTASLEDSIALYGEGQALKAHCEAKLSQATARIEAIQTDDSGAATGTRAFDAAVPVSDNSAQ